MVLCLNETLRTVAQECSTGKEGRARQARSSLAPGLASPMESLLEFVLRHNTNCNNGVDCAMN